jgi:hypothetical protein
VDKAMVKYFLYADDDTYIYGDKMFKCKYCYNTNTYIEPYYRKEKNKLIKFYRKKQFFVIYEDCKITEIIFTMTCWSDDFSSYKLKDNVAYECDKNYHGRPFKRKEPCNIDFTEFIRENGL